MFGEFFNKSLLALHHDLNTAGLKRKIVVPFVSFGLGGSRQGRGTLTVVATVPQTWFHNECFPYRFQSKWFVAYGVPSFEP